MGTVFAAMSTWTALTWHTVIKPEFKNKNVTSKTYGIFNMKIIYFKSTQKNMNIKGIAAHINKELINGILVLL